MSRSYVSLPAITFTGFLYGLAPTGSGAVVSQAAGIEIDDFSYLDTSGEPHATVHEMKLQDYDRAQRRFRGRRSVSTRSLLLHPTLCCRRIGDA